MSTEALHLFQKNKNLQVVYKVVLSNMCFTEKEGAYQYVNHDTSKIEELYRYDYIFTPTEWPDLQGRSIFQIIAEESRALNSGGFEWGYGDSDQSQNGFGIVLPFKSKLIAITLSTRLGSAEVEVYKNTDPTGATVSTTNNIKQAVKSIMDEPVIFEAGDSVNFRTVIASGASNGGKVTAWFST